MNRLRFLKKNILWFTLYGMGITAVFFYILFPSELAKQRLEEWMRSPALELKSASLSPSLPFGVTLNNVILFSPQTPDHPLFRGDRLDIQPAWWSLFSKRKYVNFSGQAYNGYFDGRVGLKSFTQPFPPVEGRLNFSNMDLGKIVFAGVSFLKGVTGTAGGSFSYVFSEATDRNPASSLALYLTKGSYPLPEPFLGVSRIDFDRGEIHGKFKGGALKFEKIEIYGTLINCILSGEISLAEDVANSKLDLKGFLEFPDKRKMKMNVTVGGTIGSPFLRYI
ncbi:MAG: type II secretion system protein GspN [Desulfobacteraceae bacterium]|nr:MAG: type II secretion system protein GspN [Desulfobacteraceae bacterium]RPI71011.1 MAG: type II secretion system protein GspN [Desulfobacteraceae bacterium]